MPLAGSSPSPQTDSKPSTTRVGGFSLPPLRYTNQQKRRFATVLIYAPARWGKTHLIKTAKNPLILATEIGEMRGLSTLSNVEIPFVGIDTEEQMTLVLAELSKHGDHVEYEGLRPDWVILDSLSNMGYIWYEASLDVHGKDMAWDPSETKDPRIIYPYVAERGRQHVKRILDLPCNICLLARERIMTTGEGKSQFTYFAPELPGQQLGKEVPGWPDATLHGVVVNNKSRLHTRKADNGKTISGIRTGEGTVPEYILPDLTALGDFMCGVPDALKRLTPRSDVA
jgi:hypothetical protein